MGGLGGCGFGTDRFGWTKDITHSPTHTQCEGIFMCVCYGSIADHNIHLQHTSRRLRLLHLWLYATFEGNGAADDRLSNHQRSELWAQRVKQQEKVYRLFAVRPVKIYNFLFVFYDIYVCWESARGHRYEGGMLSMWVTHVYCSGRRRFANTRIAFARYLSLWGHSVKFRSSVIWLSRKKFSMVDDIT